MGNVSVNIRRCDLVDNARCPIVGYLAVGESARIVGFSSNGSGWYQVQIPSGLLGWVSPTVIGVSGDVSGVPLVAPPAPLPPPAVANVVPGSISTIGETVCGQPFNVNLIVINQGDAPSQAGSVSVQDVNLSSGEVTFTGFGGYPALNPGSSYGIVVTINTTAYYNQTHELRAYVGDRVVRTSYVLGQGNCNVQPTATPPPTSRDFPPNQCFVTFTDRADAFDAPFGSVITSLAPSAREARRVEIVGGVNWYKLFFPDLGDVWVRNPETQGNCSP